MGRRIGLKTVLLIYAVLLVVYFTLLHPWLMSWGATTAEQQMALPGDTTPSGTDTYYTRAMTINAPPEKVWPWLLQIGQERAGFYSNDWLENLFGGDIHNLNVIHPEWQTRAVGERVRMAPREYLGGILGDGTTTKIRAVETERMIADTPGRFVLQPLDGGRTRLLVREPLPAAGSGPAPVLGAGATGLSWDPLHFVMVQRMMRGIKERAEGAPLVPVALQVVAHAGWVLAGIVLLGLYLVRRAWRPWLLLPVFFVVPSFYSTRDPKAALAGFLAFGRRWWSPLALIAAAVFLMLLLVPDAYAAFGLLFLVILLGFSVVSCVPQGYPGHLYLMQFLRIIPLDQASMQQEDGSVKGGGRTRSW